MIPDLISRLQQLFGNISNIIDMAKMTYCKQLKNDWGWSSWVYSVQIENPIQQKALKLSKLSFSFFFTFLCIPTFTVIVL